MFAEFTRPKHFNSYMIETDQNSGNVDTNLRNESLDDDISSICTFSTTEILIHIINSLIKLVKKR